MTEHLLDLHISTVWNPESQQWTTEVAVWDGDLYVASKAYVGLEPKHALKMALSFQLSWSRLYLDTPDLTPKTRDAHGLEQLRLWE